MNEWLTLFLLYTGVIVLIAGAKHFGFKPEAPVKSSEGNSKSQEDKTSDDESWMGSQLSEAATGASGCFMLSLTLFFLGGFALLAVKLALIGWGLLF